MTPAPWFSEHYEEYTTLENGRAVILRAIRPSDKGGMLDAFQTLSKTSRYNRFFTAKQTLSESELRYLTEVDGVNHLAVVAIGLDPIGRETGLGVARFIRDPSQPEIAEPAIVVIDALQGQGLGRLLFLRLCAAAAERGIRHFRSEVLASNDAMMTIARDAGATVHAESAEDDGIPMNRASNIMEVIYPLPSVERDEPRTSRGARGPLYELFSRVAQGIVLLQRGQLSELQDLVMGLGRRSD